MSINGPEELEGMRAAGAVVRQMLDAMRDEVRAGITTAELDEVGAGVMRQHGAKSAPALVYGFPGVNCISLNDEAVHGIPGPRALRAGFRVWEIGHAVEREVRRSGFSVIRDLAGHGIGRTIHEEPRVPNYPAA